jgi:hypothetical protein
MANIVGKWKISHSENFADFLTACGKNMLESFSLMNSINPNNAD